MDKLKGERGGLTARCGQGRAVVERRRGVVDGGAVVNGGAVVERRRAHGARGRAARWSRAARAVAARRRLGRDEAVVKGGATTAARRKTWAAPPLQFLSSARSVDLREGEGADGYIAEGHRSRAVASPGTYDSLVPGDATARDR